MSDLYPKKWTRKVSTFYVVELNKLNNKYMSKIIFTKNDIEELSKNENIAKCSEGSITYGQVFKIEAVKLYEQGLTPGGIFKQAEINLSMIGRKKPKDCLRRWNKIYRKSGEKGLIIENRGRNSTGRPKKLRDKSDTDKIKRLEAEVAYLRAENAFLIKLRAKKRAE